MMKERCDKFCEILPHLKSARYVSKNRYYNYCVECEKSFPDGLYVIDPLGRKCCPCCGKLLRTKRRNPPRYAELKGFKLMIKIPARAQIH